MSPSPRFRLSATTFLLLFATSCGSCQQGAGQQSGSATNNTADANIVFSEEGELTRASEHIGTALVQRFDVNLQAPGTYLVTLSSSAFDPLVHVTTPEGFTLSNDDFQGSHEHSQLSIDLHQASTIKVAVTSHRGDGTGRYRLLVRRVGGGTAAQETLVAGGRVSGELSAEDAKLPDGRAYDTVMATGPGSLRVEAQGQVLPQVAVVDPAGNPVWQGQDGTWTLVTPGNHRVQIMAPSANQLASYQVSLAAPNGPPTPTLARGHHQLPTGPGAAPITVGRALEGALADGDGALPSGELADIFTLTVAEANVPLAVQLDSEAFDPYLMVVGPTGQYWENDDYGGTRNSRLEMTAPTAGAYRVVATGYRNTDRGAYQLAVSRGGARTVDLTNVTSVIGGTGASGAPSAGGDVQTIRGSLQNGDEQLDSGELYDTHRLTIPAGQSVSIRARSSQFDTYLIVQPPSGDQQDNDDGPGGGTDAQVDLVSIGGEYRVLVTSYEPGESGDYELVVTGAGGGSGGTGGSGGAPTPPPSASGATQRGNLAQGDRQLPSGEYADALTMSFNPGASVQLRLTSTQFDTYLIVRTPSGRQLDNDDFEAGSTNSGVDIPSAEAGAYQLLVTSYQPGETGAWSLVQSAGASVPHPDGGGGGGGAGGSGGRVFGLFAGISDYPGGANDLPECANDATRLAETLHNEGLLPSERQVVLTDSQATTTNIRQNMQRLSRELGPDDVFVFFYSGHGGQTASSNDTREIDGKDEYLVLYDGQLVDDELGRLFDAMPARISLVAIDACHSGGFAKDIITRPGRVGLFSSEEDVLSAVAGQFQAGGYLSYFLRMAMQGDADMNPRDHVLTVGELTHHVYTQFGSHATDIQLAAAYQHLVVDRGAVGVDQVLWAYR